MSIITFQITEDLVTKRTHARIMREVLRTSMLRHRDHRLGKHFKDIAETRPGGGYHYEQRNPEYVKAKLKRKGHRRPLVWSGRTMRFVRNNSRITATQKRARLTARNYFPLTLQRREEIEAFTPREKQEVEQGIQRLYLKEAAKPENRRRRKRRVTNNE